MNAFVKNYLWPTVSGFAFAIVTALATNAPAVLVDGLQQGDLAKLGATAVAAALGFLANILDRHAGANWPWLQPKA
jgi:hypothetical protein